MWDTLGQWLEDNLQEWANQTQHWLDQWDQMASDFAGELREWVETLVDPILPTDPYSNRIEPHFEEADPFDARGFVVEEFQVSSFGLGLIVTYRSSGIPLAIGDPSCVYNARSCQLRCAVNPDGPCEGCKHYESR